MATIKRCSTILLLAGLACAVSADTVRAQAPPAQAQPPATAAQGQQPPQATAPPVAPAPSVATPSDYVIGPSDVLQVTYWREKDMSAQVTVRPDGIITLPLINDVQASGLTPDQLRDKISQMARKFLEEDPTVSVTVVAINSRRVFITGNIARPGPYPLNAPTTVLQLIAMAGGLTEFADQGKIAVMREEDGKIARHIFNYKDVAKGKHLEQNIELKPGDTVIVP